MEIKERIQKRSRLLNENIDQMIDDIFKISELIVDSIKNRRKIMFCGNGGSAAESQHMAAEYCATLNHKNFRSGIPAISLTVDTSFLTAWTNDFNYSEVFSRQIETLGQVNDVLMCYSTSGTSTNIVEAAKMAKSMGIKVILFTGKNKDLPIKDYCDYIMHAPSLKTAIIQEFHTIIGHEVCMNVENELFSFK
jgi:D-sedoheptulose 7-phosphate isomerase